MNRIWRIYADWDPLFIRVPPFLRIMCGLEVFVFGPCYLISAMVLRCRVLPPWFPCFSLFFSGALFYSTVLYFAYEWLFAPSAYVNVTMVALVNAPWAIFAMRSFIKGIEPGKRYDRVIFFPKRLNELLQQF